jgi:uncharacterized membrane protein (DUF106 family)
MQGFEFILVFSIGISFLIVLIYRLMTDMDELKEIKQKLNEYKKKLSEAQKKNDMKEYNSLFNEMMKINSKQFKMNIKPMFISLIIALLSLSYLKSQYDNVLVNLPVSLPLFGNDMGWLWWYILISIPATMFFRKMLSLD